MGKVEELEAVSHCVTQQESGQLQQEIMSFTDPGQLSEN